MSAGAEVGLPGFPEFSSRTRRAFLEGLSVGPHTRAAKFDAVIIGGGIVGAGLARELAIRGKRCLLVEKNDFASGTSSKSSKLIHGGLRYLEMFDFGLVFESLAERHWLLKTHPHLVSPLKFNLPIYKKGHGPAKARAGWMLGMGLWLYDALSLFHTPVFHGKYSLEQTLKKVPGLRSEGLAGSYFYGDAMMLDDELVLECIYDAYRRGAQCVNYVEAVGVDRRETDGLFKVRLKDTFGEAPAMEAYAHEVIVCVGPWTQKFGDSSVCGGAERKLKPSRGVHLIFSWDRFPVEECLVMYAPDGRIIFAIPRKDLGEGAAITIVGTTDAPDVRDPGAVRTENEDIEYLLKVVRDYFPDKKFNESDILTTYAGVRPLMDDGEHDEAKTSREHEIWHNSEGVIFMAGGKYTTFRKISQEIADTAFPMTGRRDRESKKVLCTPKEYASRFSGAPFWGRFTEGWVDWKIRYHMACTVEDILHRRVPVWMGGKAALERCEPKAAAMLKNFKAMS